MSDTTMQNCKCCETEDDCINGLCELCSIYNQKLQKQSDLLTLGLLKEKNKYDTLKASRDNLVKALERYGDHEPCCMKGDACNCGYQKALKEAEKL